MDGYSTGKFFRFAHAEVDLGALAHNFRSIAHHVGNGVGMMAMVKADAYGHGAVPVSKKLVECGVTALGVATVEEGLELRQEGIDVPIIVMGGLMGMGTPASGVMLSANLTPVIHSAEVVKSLDMVAQSMGKRVGIQLKVDTGMTRLGIRPESLAAVLDRLTSCSSLVVEGVMTHLAKASDPEYTSYQLEEFAGAKRLIESVLGSIPLWHVANSSAIANGVGLRIPGAQTIWVRPGIVLYGGMESSSAMKIGSIRPVLRFISRLVLIKSVPPGTKVSYDCTFTTQRRSRLGLIPIGYADGYPLALTDRAFVLVKGSRAPVVGRVTMDMIMVDVTDIPEAAVGDEVVMIGKQGDDEITACDMAEWANTISYEILTGISARVPRVYKD